MADRGIALEWAASRYVVQRHDGIRLRIEAVCAVGMTADIFAYRMLPVDPSTGSQAGFFDHVCSTVDLEEYPANEPRENEAPQWFRLSYVDVLVRSQTEAANFLIAVKEDVRMLKATLDIQDTLIPEGRDEVGVGCELPSSSSSSSIAPSSSESSSVGG